MKYTLILSAEHLAAISEGLLTVPYGRAAPVIHDINQQLGASQAQARFDAAADARDMPSGATTPPDLLKGD